jgi:hypothetical protein
MRPLRAKACSRAVVLLHGLVNAAAAAATVSGGIADLLEALVPYLGDCGDRILVATRSRLRLKLIWTFCVLHSGLNDCNVIPIKDGYVNRIIKRAGRLYMSSRHHGSGQLRSSTCDRSKTVAQMACDIGYELIQSLRGQAELLARCRFAGRCAATTAAAAAGGNDGGFDIRILPAWTPVELVEPPDASLWASQPGGVDVLIRSVPCYLLLP